MNITKPAPLKERTVGIAYTTWHRSVPWHHVWGVPERGYYVSDDRRIIRQHAEWLTYAGVDFVWIDWSNNLFYVPGETQNRPDFDMIERSVDVMFEEYAKLKRAPKISIFIGCPDHPEAVRDGLLTRKADQVWRQFGLDPHRKAMLPHYQGKPLLVVYVGTPSPFPSGVPDWTHPEFTVRWMTGFITQQPHLMGPGRVSRYGYWSWEDRGEQTYPVVDGVPEAMVITACWRPEWDGSVPTPGRRNGETFRKQWARARQLGVRHAMVVSWNEWTLGEQSSAEVSKDIEPSRQHGRRYLEILREQISLFKRGV